LHRTAAHDGRRRYAYYTLRLSKDGQRAGLVAYIVNLAGGQATGNGY